MCGILSSWSSASTQKLLTLFVVVISVALCLPARGPPGAPVEEDEVVDLKVFQVKPGDLEQSTAPDDPCADFSMGGSQLHKFSSPNFPANYPPSLECIRVVNAPMGYDITVDFRGAYFEVEASYERPEGSSEGEAMNCPNDFLEIRDGKYGFSPLIGRFCGMRIPRRPVRAISGYMWMRFHSDDILEYRGFEAEYQFVRSPKERLRHNIDCLITETAQHDGFIQTMHMHKFYEHYRNSTGNLECVWKVVSPTADLQMRFFMREFELGKPNLCQMNFMEVYSGTTADQPVRKFCGLTASNVATSSNIAYVRIFATGEAMQGLNIRALFSTYTKSKNCSGESLFSCGDDSCVPLSVVCNKRTNCLYRKDEHGCKFNELQMPKMFLPGAYMIILVIVCTVIVAVILCAIVINYCPKFKRQQAKYDAFLKELASRPPPGITVEHRRHTIATMNPTHEQLLAAGFTTPIVDSAPGGRVTFVVGNNGDKLRSMTSSPAPKRTNKEPKLLPSALDIEDEPGSAFIKENRFATVGTPAPILRKTWSKSGKRSLVEKPLLHRLPVDLDTDQSSSIMTMSRSGVSGLSSTLSNSRDHEDMEMTILHVGRAAQPSGRLPRLDQQRGSGRRRTQDAPTPDLILNGMLGAGQARLASTSSSEGGGKPAPTSQYSSNARKLVTFTGALDSSIDSAESEVCFPIHAPSSGRQTAAPMTSRRSGRPTATTSNLSQAYQAEMMEEEDELIEKHSPQAIRRPSSGRSGLQLEYSALGGASNHVVKFVDANNQEVDRKDYPNRSFIARI